MLFFLRFVQKKLTSNPEIKVRGEILYDFFIDECNIFEGKKCTIKNFINTMKNELDPKHQHCGVKVMGGSIQIEQLYQKFWIPFVAFLEFNNFTILHNSRGASKFFI